MSKTTTSPEIAAGSAPDQQQTQAQQKPLPVTELVLWLAEDCPVGCAVCYARPGVRIMAPDTARQAVEWLCREEVSGNNSDLVVELGGREPLLAWDTIQDLLEWWPKFRKKRGKKITFRLSSPGTAYDARKRSLLEDPKTASLFETCSIGHRGETLPWQECSPLNPVALPEPPSLGSRSRTARPADSRSSWVRLPILPANLDLKSQVQQALQEGAQALYFAPDVQAGWGIRQDTITQDLLKVLEPAFEELTRWYTQEARGGKLLPLESTHALLRLIHKKKQGEAVPKPYNPCLQADRRLLVAPEGHLMACQHWLSHSFWWLGNLQEGIYEVRRHALLEYQRTHFLACHRCPAEEVCPGPCLGLIQDVALDFYDPIPGHCFFLRAHYAAAQKIYATLLEENNPLLGQMLGARTS